MSREIHDLNKRLSNGEIETVNTGNIGNIRMFRALDMMCIKVTKHKNVLKWMKRERHLNSVI